MPNLVRDTDYTLIGLSKLPGTISVGSPDGKVVQLYVVKSASMLDAMLEDNPDMGDGTCAKCLDDGNTYILMGREWVVKASGSGGGTPGDMRDIEFNVDGTTLQWRYVDDPDWIDIVDLDSLNLSGAQGEPGLSVITPDTDAQGFDEGALLSVENDKVKGVTLLERQVIGVSGTLQRLGSITADLYEVAFMPTAGELNTIQGGKWICPRNGVYSFSSYYGFLLPPTASEQFVYYYVNDELAGVSEASGTSMTPLLNMTKYLEADDVVTMKILSHLSRTGTDESIPSFFTITQLSSVLQTEPYYITGELLMPNSFPATTWLRIPLIPAEGNVGDIVNGTWICPSTGLYSINVTIGALTTIDTFGIFAEISKNLPLGTINGSTIGLFSLGSTSSMTQVIGFLYASNKLDAGDIVELLLFTHNVNSLNTLNSKLSFTIKLDIPL